MKIKNWLFPLCCISPFTYANSGQTEDYWDIFDIFQSDDASFSMSGRLHGDIVNVDSDDGEFSDDIWRRLRLGGKGEINGFSFKLEGDFDLNNGMEYKRITDAYISWKTDNGTKVKVLKQGVKFTQDGATSSNELKTLERSNIANNLWFSKEYFTGVNLSGAINQEVSYEAGFYSSDGDNEIAVGAGAFALGALIVKSNTPSFWDSARYRFDLVINEEHERASTRNFSEVYSMSSQWKKGKFGLDAEFAGGNGYFDQSDIWGVSVTPYYDFNENFQLVTRYTYMKSKEENGLRLNRYEGQAVEGRGDKYQEVYSGINYLINGHKLKLQLGVQYTNMEDAANDGGEFEGLTISSGIRMSW